MDKILNQFIIMLQSVTKLVVNTSEAGAHLAGGAREIAQGVEDNAARTGAIRSIEHTGNMATRLKDFGKTHSMEDLENAERFFQIYQKSRESMSSYEASLQAIRNSSNETVKAS